MEPNDPTPDEIREHCARIREGWSEREHWRRAGFPSGSPRWLPPGAPPAGMRPSELAAACVCRKQKTTTTPTD